MLGYTLLVLGLLAWSGSHLWKRIAPDSRARFGEGGRGIVAIASLAGIVLMVLGYRWAPADVLWHGRPGLVHLNNLLMLLVFYLFAASGMKTRATQVIRHPQLWGVRLWAIAHLLVNGTVADLVLFGGLFVWAQIEVTRINRAALWDRPVVRANPGKEIGAGLGAVIALVVVGYVHGWLGAWPFG